MICSLDDAQPIAGFCGRNAGTDSEMVLIMPHKGCSTRACSMMHNTMHSLIRLVFTVTLASPTHCEKIKQVHTISELSHAIGLGLDTF